MERISAPPAFSGPVWITGAAGLIGRCLMQLAPAHAPRTTTLGLTRADLELTDAAAVRARFAHDQPGLIIHCAAMTRSDACAADPAAAQRVNVEATALLASLAARIPFIFFSTDLVFDGRTGHYDESSAVNPLSTYGESKLAAEQVVLQNPLHTVVRTSLNFGVSASGDRSFNEQLRNTWRQGRPIGLFTDEFRCPIPATVTARALWELAAAGQSGLFHLAGAERLSRWQIGALLAARWPQLNPRLTASSLRDYSGPPRPADTSLNCAKVQALLSFPLPGLSRWLVENPNEWL